jgi:hypothetical protein
MYCVRYEACGALPLNKCYKIFQNGYISEIMAIQKRDNFLPKIRCKGGNMYHHKPFSFDDLTKAEKKILRSVARPNGGWSGGGGSSFAH